MYNAKRTELSTFAKDKILIDSRKFKMSVSNSNKVEFMGTGTFL